MNDPGFDSGLTIKTIAETELARVAAERDRANLALVLAALAAAELHEALQTRHAAALAALNDCRAALRPHSPPDPIDTTSAYLNACAVLAAEKERHAT